MDRRSRGRLFRCARGQIRPAPRASGERRRISQKNGGRRMRRCDAFATIILPQNAGQEASCMESRRPASPTRPLLDLQRLGRSTIPSFSSKSVWQFTVCPGQRRRPTPPPLRPLRAEISYPQSSYLNQARRLRRGAGGSSISARARAYRTRTADATTGFRDVPRFSVY